MKKVIFAFALLLQTVFVFANDDKAAQTSRVESENVKMYRQPAANTEVVKTLGTSDEVVVVRKHNSKWSIVTVNGEVGYILTSKLVQSKAKK